MHHRIHAEFFKFDGFFAQQLEVVPRIGRSGQIDAVSGNGLNHEPPDALRNEFEAAMQPAVITRRVFLISLVPRRSQSQGSSLCSRTNFLKRRLKKNSMESKPASSMWRRTGSIMPVVMP